jgi:hypothetical protein
MKRYSLALTICLALSGCGSKSYEQQAGLTPLPTPVAVAGADLSSSKVNEAVQPMEAAINNATTPEALQTIITQNAMAQGFATGFIGNAPGTASMMKEYSDNVAFNERAAVIKKRQLEAGDKTDSTGEVAKYLSYSRQSIANMVAVSPHLKN